MFYRQQSQTHRIEKLKNGRVRANAQRKREYGDDRKTGALPKLAHCVTKVSAEATKKFRLPSASSSQWLMRSRNRACQPFQQAPVFKLGVQGLICLIDINTSYEHFLIAVAQVLAQLFNNLGFACWLKIEPGNGRSYFLRPIRHFPSP